MQTSEQVQATAQKLIDSLEKEIENIQRRIEGIIILYKQLAGADGQSGPKESSLPSGEKKEEEPS